MNRCLIFGGTAGVVALASVVTSGHCGWGMRSQIFFALPFALAFATVLCDGHRLSPESVVARGRRAVVVAAPTLTISRFLVDSRDEVLMNAGTAMVTVVVTLLVAGATAWDGPSAQSRLLKVASVGATVVGFSILPSVVAGLFAWITTGGALPMPDHLLVFYDWLGGGLLELRPFLSSWMLPGAGIIALALGRRFGIRTGLVASDILIGLAILGWGYRFTGLVAIVALVLMDAFGTPAPLDIRKRALAWLALLIVCSLPFDVSLYDSVPPPKWTPASSGLWTGSQYEYMEQGEYYVVGSCVPFYLEPRWMWTW